MNVPANGANRLGTFNDSLTGISGLMDQELTALNQGLLSNAMMLEIISGLGAEILGFGRVIAPSYRGRRVDDATEMRRGSLSTDESRGEPKRFISQFPLESKPLSVDNTNATTIEQPYPQASYAVASLPFVVSNFYEDSMPVLDPAVIPGTTFKEDASPRSIPLENAIAPQPDVALSFLPSLLELSSPSLEVLPQSFAPTADRHRIISTDDRPAGMAPQGAEPLDNAIKAANNTSSRAVVISATSRTPSDDRSAERQTERHRARPREFPTNIATPRTSLGDVAMHNTTRQTKRIETDTLEPRRGMILLDGAQLGRWMLDHLAIRAARPGSGATSIDPRISATFPGPPSDA
jgi:hypothetical protein